jgi:hypothetical protein
MSEAVLAAARGASRVLRFSVAARSFDGAFAFYFNRATSHARSATISSAQTECGIGYACH